MAELTRIEIPKDLNQQAFLRSILSIPGVIDVEVSRDIEHLPYVNGYTYARESAGPFLTVTFYSTQDTPSYQIAQKILRLLDEYR